MRSLRSRLRAARRDERGISLTELLVTMMIFGMLMAMITSVMITLTNMSKDSVSKAQAIQEARLGISQIDRQVRSGNVILDPEVEPFEDSGVVPFFSLRIYTQEDGINKCAQWRVIDHDLDGFGDLEYRTWLPSGLDLTTWSPVAHNLIEMSDPPASSSEIKLDDPDTWPPFWVNENASGNTQAQFITITLRLKDPGESATTKATTLTTTVMGRNTVFSTPTSYCDDIPTT